MKTTLLLLGSSFLLLISSCHRDKIDMLGPPICPDASFHTQSKIVVPDTINFSVTPKLIIKETLSQSVAWTLTIKGLTSGAEKKFTGNGTEIDVIWDGRPGSDIFFTKEDCSVSISVPCLNTVYSKKVKITQASDFSAISYTLWNFENASSIFSTYGAAQVTFSAGLYNFPSSPAHIAPSPQGGGYFNFTGQVIDAKNPTYYFGGMDAGTLSSAKVKALIAKTSDDPNHVYFNCYINTNGKASMAYFQIRERFVDPEDGEISIVKRPAISFSGNGFGWKHISFKLSDAGLLKVEDLKQLTVTFEAGPNSSSECEVNLDMPIFTVDKPFIEN